MTDKFTKGDTTAQTLTKFFARVLFTEKHTIIGILLMSTFVSCYIAVTVIELHFEKFGDVVTRLDKLAVEVQTIKNRFEHLHEKQSQKLENLEHQLRRGE